MKFITTEEELDLSLDRLKEKSIIAVDTETTGLDPFTSKVLLIQIGDFEEQYVFDVAKLGISIFKITEWLSKDNNCTKILHNAKFDYKMLKKNFKCELKNFKDTMLAEKLLNAGKNVGAGLDDVVAKYCGVPLDKSSQKSFALMKFGDTFSSKQVEYSGEDVKYLINVYISLMKLIDSRGMRGLYDLENETCTITAEMELAGITVNKSKWLEVEKQQYSKVAEARKKLDAHFSSSVGVNLFGELNLNYNSPQQLKPALEKILGYSLESTSEKVIKYIDEPVVLDLLSWRGYNKRITTYGTEFLTHVNTLTGRIHSDYKQLDTESGRFASAAPNLTNIPKEQEYRSCFVAPNPNYKIISADFSAQEPRILAFLSEDEAFGNVIKSGKDLHKESARLIYSINYEDVTREQRTSVKSIALGLTYGMGAKKLSKELAISFPEAQALIERYFAVFPGIRSYLKNVEENFKKTKIAFSPIDGRRRDFHGMDWDNKGLVAYGVNVAKNLPCQGGGATITKRAMCDLHKKLGRYDAKIILSVHDKYFVVSKPY